ncbi:MAG: hypothetical protein WCK42_04045 [Myxococcaceae bacterium]
MKILLLGLLFLTPAYSYKFLCNGITAEGETESDTCGACTDATGPRWLNQKVSYNISTKQIPTGISVSDWVSLVKSSFASWTEVPGVLLTMTYGSEGARSFGEDEKSQDVSWVNGEAEWMDKVGAAPNGILGVTLPSYKCPQEAAANYRVIDDADMILNNVPSAGFTWSQSCSMLTEKCQSIRGTMTHEMGHFLGLGHPFASGQAIMSAQASFLIDYPLFDDQQGLVALYPAASAPVAMGGKCIVDGDCLSGLTCHAQDQIKYCSSNIGTCSNHMVLVNNGFCEYPSGALLGAVKLHEDCSQSVCDTDLICVGVAASTEYCFAECTPNKTSCGPLETCHQLHDSKHQPINSYACMQEVKEGEKCGNIITCQTGLTCTVGVCVVTPKQNLTEASFSSPSPSSNPENSSCSSVKTPGEIWLLLCLMGILIHRPKKKC